jgi:hypothetical protein
MKHAGIIVSLVGAALSVHLLLLHLEIISLKQRLDALEHTVTVTVTDSNCPDDDDDQNIIRQEVQLTYPIKISQLGWNQ